LRILRLAFFSFIILFLAITGISLFIPSHIRISKAINIGATRDAVIKQISDAANWTNWYPGLDSARPLYVNGIIKGVVFNGRDSLNQVYLVMDKENKDEITAQYVNKKRKPVINGWKVINYPATDSLTVQWYMDFHLPWYPWEKFRSLLFEKIYGARMEQGLTNLKHLVEK
jgi:hypothetical protein